MKFKVGDKVKMTEAGQKQCFVKGTEFAWGIVTKVYPHLDEIRVKRYFTGTYSLPYRGHEITWWAMEWWRKK